MENNIYWLGRKLYALAMDLAEKENKIKIAKTENAEFFCEQFKKLLIEYFQEIKF